MLNADNQNSSVWLFPIDHEMASDRMDADGWLNFLSLGCKLGIGGELFEAILKLSVISVSLPLAELL